MKRLVDKQRKRTRRKHHIRKKVSGTPEKPRMSVTRSNNRMYIQVIDDKSGHTLASASTLEPDLRALKNNKENAEKLGQVIGERLKEKNIKQVVFDRNGYMYHGIVKCIADGTRKAGINF